MKKNFIAMGVMLAATLTLTNCAKEMTNPVEIPSDGTPFEIFASTAETRTINDGMATKWEAGDTINLFHAVTETADYINDGKYIIAEEDLEDGRFTGELTGELSVDGVYDWYAFFPYLKKIESPVNTTGYAYIGHSKGLNQDGYGSKAALKRSVCPLYGIAKAVKGDKVPSITMQHLSSVVAINVVNDTETPLKVTTASLIAEESIVGSYYIDFSGDPKYTDSGANYVFNTATVNVSNATELAKGESAVLYLAIKPFTAKSGSKLILSVNGYKKELTLEKDVTFHAGKIKTLKFDYDYVEVIDGDKIEWASSEDWTGVGEAEIGLESGDYSVVINKQSGQTKPTVNATANDCRAYANNTITVSHSSNNITSLVFHISTNGLKRLTDLTPSTGEVEVDVENAKVSWTGDASTVTFTVGEKAVYGTDGSSKAGQICFDYIVAKIGGAAVDPEPEPEPEPDPEPELQEVTISDFLAAEVSDTQLYRVTGTIVSISEISATYKNATLTISDGTNELYVYRMKPAEGGLAIEEIGLTVGDELTIDGYRGEYNGNTQMVSGVYVSHIDKEAPEQGEAQVVTAAEFLAAAESSSTVYRLTGTITNVESINTQYGNATLTISDDTGEVYIFRMKPAEEGAAIDQIGLTVGDELTVEGNRGSYNGSPQLINGVYVSHVDKEAPVSKADVIIDFSKQEYDNAEVLETLTIDDVTISFAKGSNSNSPKYYTTGAAVRVYGGNSFSISSTKAISRMQFYFASGEGSNEITSNTGTLSSNEWTGSASSITFTVGGTSGHRRIAKIEVYYN